MSTLPKNSPNHDSHPRKQTAAPRQPFFASPGDHATPKSTLFLGDALDVVRGLPANSIDSVVTDPPGGIGFMGKKWDGNKGGSRQWIAWLTLILAETYRVLKPGGHMAIWSFPRTSHWTAMAVENANFEFIQKLIHIFATGRPPGLMVKAEDLPASDGFGTTLRPSHEEWLLVRKPLEGTVLQNLKKWGVGAMNIKACSVMGDPGQPPRFPGTIIHDGSDAAMTIFPDSPGQIAKLRGDGAPMGNKTYGKMNHGKVAKPPRVDSSSSYGRFFVQIKATKKDKNEGLGIGEINPHPTVKSVELMRYITRLVTPPRGTILDMFAGSGSTGKAAALEGFDFIGCDVSEEYLMVASKRIVHALRSSGVKKKTKKKRKKSS